MMNLLIQFETFANVLEKMTLYNSIFNCTVCTINSGAAQSLHANVQIFDFTIIL